MEGDAKMNGKPRATLVGFKTLPEAQQCLYQLTKDYMISVVTEGTFDGTPLAYIVVRKDYEPIVKGQL
jgi:hypothetical protein